MHRKYGPVVRIAPNELSYIEPQAWYDIYSMKPGRISLSKELEGHVPMDEEGIFTVQDDIGHARIRKLIAAGFSNKSLTDQEPRLNRHFDLIIKMLARSHGKVDISHWMTLFSSDVISDLMFGQSFNSLHRGDHHTVTKHLDKAFFAFVIVAATHRAVPIVKFLVRAVPPRFLPWFHQAITASNELLDKRIAKANSEPDFLKTAISQLNATNGISRTELNATAIEILFAGTETTATLLTSAVYLILSNPDVHKRCKSEIRNAFAHSYEINMSTTLVLPYLAATIEETKRLRPPIAITFPRFTRPDGAIICGKYVPGKTFVGVQSWSAYRSKDNFTDPHTFIPDRWMAPCPERYTGDKKGVIKAFGIGPRSCLGRNLADAEVRVVLCRLFWNFDMSLCEESLKWDESMKTYGIWRSPKLWVQLAPAKVEKRVDT